MLIRGDLIQICQTQKMLLMFPEKHFCQTQLKSFAKIGKKRISKKTFLKEVQKDSSKPKKSSSDNRAEKF